MHLIYPVQGGERRHVTRAHALHNVIIRAPKRARSKICSAKSTKIHPDLQTGFFWRQSFTGQTDAGWVLYLKHIFDTRVTAAPREAISQDLRDLVSESSGTARQPGLQTQVESRTWAGGF